jgi:glycosyltransferase involved in cell wall biosynthesis
LSCKISKSEVSLLLPDNRSRQFQTVPRALHIIQSLAVRNGGTSVSVPALAGAIGATGRYENWLLHFAPQETNMHEECSGLTILHHSSSSIGLMLPTRARAFLAQAVRESDVVQVHGIWTGHSIASVSFATRFRKPVIVSAHGMLDGWALQHKKWKKSPYSKFVERPNLTRATCLRALTTAEARDYRSFGLGVPIAVIPNGVAVPDNASPAEFLDRYPHLQGKKIVLFLGRLHKKKGVDLLVQAWNVVSPQFPDAHLVIAGPDDGALGRLSRFEGFASMSNSITICGLLTGALKWSALMASSAFVLPSFSEGLSMAILEALWQGIPIMITRECNFREIEDLECTFVIQPSVPSIIEGLRSVLTRSPGELQARGKTGARFVRDRYSWSSVGCRMADLYDWMRGGPPPSSVELLTDSPEFHTARPYVQMEPRP